jgi:hypothetical protein
MNHTQHPVHTAGYLRPHFIVRRTRRGIGPEIKNFISGTITNAPGWRTHRKIVVFESDDWGSIRMPSKDVYHILLKKGIRVDQCPYNRFDSLESDSDLTALFDVLTSFRTANGKHPVITANSVVANPDFTKIEQSGFEEYYFETVRETYARHPRHANSFALIREGMARELFYPQFHGREHLNVSRWMSALRNKLPESSLAYHHGVFGISTDITAEKRKSYLAAMDYDAESDRLEKHDILRSGLELFESEYGYKSESYIAANYIWGNDLLPVLYDHGVTFIQGMRSQSHPDPSSGKNYSIRHTLGERTRSGQLYLIRNCFFEPALTSHIDPVDSCLREMRTAFLWKKPSVISVHRINFMGGIEESNREKNLRSFHALLTSIIRTWPDVEFMTSTQLGETIRNAA